MKNLLIAFGIILLSAATSMAQPLADRVPADTLVYVGWAGIAILCRLSADPSQSRARFV